MANDTEEHYHTGLYERAVRKITEWVKPSLHLITEKFIAKSVNKYAKDDPKFARMIEFEVRRRGDGAGLTQDVAEPLLWAGIKTAAALHIVIPVEFMKNKKKFVWMERAAAVSILLNNAVELFRLVPRYKAGLQGSLEMARDRKKTIDATGIDPFGQQTGTREIDKRTDREFAKEMPKRAPIEPTSVMQQAGKRQRSGSYRRIGFAIRLCYNTAITGLKRGEHDSQ